MLPSTKYYVRVRYKSSSGRQSPWSPASFFTTREQTKYFNTELQKIIASDGNAGDMFGSSVALSSDGSYLAVSAPYDDNGSTNSGSVYIYIKSGAFWVFQKLIRASDPASNDYFGNAIALNGDGTVLAVGAYMEDMSKSNGGSVYIFNRSGSVWSQVAKLTASNNAKNDYFGSSLALSLDGTRLIVGAPRRASYQGSAYVFQNFDWGWQQSSELVPNDPVASAYFGQSVAITGDGLELFVGAYGPGTTNPKRAGRVYLFTMPQSDNPWWWTQADKISSPTPAASDYFGRTVAVSADGSTLLAGAYSTTTSGDTAGAVYAYKKINGDYVSTYKLMSDDRSYNDWFGSALALSADGALALIGAYGDDDSGSQSGATYSFKQTMGAWEFVNKTLCHDGEVDGLFGVAIAVSGNGLLAAVAATGSSGRTIDTGAVYLFN